MINPLRSVNSYWNLLCVKRWSEPSPNTYGVIDAFLSSGFSSTSAALGAPVDDPHVRFPKIVFENAMNNVDVDYQSLVTAQGADALYLMDEAAGNFADSISGLNMVANGTFTRQIAASGLDVFQDPTFGASLDGATAYGVPPADNIFGGIAHTAKSIVLWVRPSNTSGTQVLWEEGDLTNGLCIYMDNATAAASVWSGAGAGNEVVKTVRSSWPLRKNDWNMVAVVFDLAGGFVNVWGESSPGILAHSSMIPGFASLPAHASAIGVGSANGETRTEYEAHNFGAGQGLHYAGGLDNITYYNKALTRPELYAIWWAGYAGVGAL